MAGRRPSAEESALWRTAMRAVHPRRPAPPAPPPPPDPVSAPLEQKENPPAPVAAPVEPRGTGLDRRSAQRLKRGQMAIEARLDLHGLTQDEAHRALHRFIARMHEEGRRAVLIITGKGARDGVGGVLRQGVPRWLAEPACRASILAVEEAQSRHGGGGALYVLLRRRR